MLPSTPDASSRTMSSGSGSNPGAAEDARDPHFAAGAASASDRVVRVGGAALAWTALALCALWALDVFVLRTGLLARWRDGTALTPLYAFWSPFAMASALAFPAVAVATVLCAPRITDPSRTGARTFVLALVLVAGACALALYLVRMPASSLGMNFNLYRDEEFWHDAQRIQDASAYLAHYVELMPRFSTHGKHFPPGHALLLHGVITTFGRSELAAGLVVLACALAALPLCWLALRELVRERAARQGALLVALAPAFLDFSCTAMDAVFLLVASLALWLGLRAFGPRGRTRDALLAGVALFAATFFSFSTLPLGFALAAYAFFARRGAAWRPLAQTGATYATCALALWLSTEFALWSSFFAGHEHAQAFMDRVRASKPHTERWRIVLGNPVAFALGAGIPLVAACAVRIARERLPRDAWSRAALVALALMSALHYLETERIWMYALPWIAALALAEGPLEDRSLRRLAALSLAQAFVMEALLFTLW